MTATPSPSPIAVYYEHPDWFRPLFSELERRELPVVRLDAASHRYDPSEAPPDCALVVNRASPSAYLRNHAHTIFYTLHWLRHLERLGVPVVNGSTAYALELSKASQLTLLNSLGLPYPNTRVINAPAQALLAARGLRYPLLIKANVGGSGAGISRYDSEDALADAVARGQVRLGIDGTALVQECAPLRGGHITRVETLNGAFLYAIDVYPAEGSFDLCPADACQTVAGLRAERASPSREVIEEVEAIARAAALDVGGIEYLVDDRDGRRYYYDINALSNFVADAPNVVGFDPWAAFADYLELRAGALSEAGR